MKRQLKTFLVVCLAATAFGCTPDPKSGEGFTLPEGNAERGQATFVELQCHACHTVNGVAIDPIESDEETIVPLGGKKGYVVTYGELVTSIVNPSHRVALGYAAEEIQEGDESKMRFYNDEMTVTQLIDLVTFLQQHYEVKVYYPTPYAPFY